MPERIPERLQALTDTAEELVKEVNRLNGVTGPRVQGITTRLRRNQKILWVVVVSFLVDIVVTAVVAFNAYKTQENTTEIETIQGRLNYSQDVQRRKVLCPLYKIFVDSKSEQGRATYPEGPEEYDRLFGIIETSYKALECNKPVPEGPITEEPSR